MIRAQLPLLAAMAAGYDSAPAAIPVAEVVRLRCSAVPELSRIRLRQSISPRGGGLRFDVQSFGV